MNTPTAKEFVISKTFDAPRDLLWKALTEPERMQEWFSPKGCTSRSVKFDFSPGGTYLYCMTTPDGNEMWGKAVYREIEKPNKIVYINSFSDANGGTTHHPMSATWPLEMITTFTLADDGGKTKLTVTWLPINAAAAEIETFNSAHDGMRQGWAGTFEHLTEYLAKAS